MALHVDFFTFHVAGTDLISTAKRYTDSDSDMSKDGLTLVFAHGVGSHKEQWEPTIQRIFSIQQRKHSQNRIREAWAFDWQSHGDAAIFNEKALGSRTCAVSPVEWALALESFVKRHLNGHHVVALGHSAGTAAIIMSMKNFPAYKSPYIAVFLVEPTIISQELFNERAKEREDSANMSMKVTLARRDSWPDKGTAAAYLRRRLPWRLWDSRVFDIYINHGIHTISKPDGEVAYLKASKIQEGTAYPQFSPYIESVALFRERCQFIPFHLIFGDKFDFMPEYMQEDLLNTGKPASVTRVPNAGHLIVQENPDGLAVAICNRLNSADLQMKSRL